MDKIGRYSEALDAQVELAEFWLNSQTARNYIENQEKKWDDDRLPFRITTGAFLNSLVYGETYYWSTPICQLIMGASQSLPQSWTLSEEMLDSLCGFAWLATPCDVPPSERPVSAIAWIPVVADGQKVRVLLPPYVHRPKLNDPEWHLLSVVFFSQTTLAEFPYLPTQWFWPFGYSISQLLDNARNRETNLAKVSLFATMLAFLQQRILIPQKSLADRMARHRFERAKQKPPSDEIQVVILRPIERRTGEGEHRNVERTCRWIVRGHWRNQWYPSQKHYRPKYIASYLKGPEDKPLRNPGRLFAVVR